MDHLAQLIRIARVLGREDGQTLTEYSLVIVFVAVGLVLALGTFRDEVVAMYQTASTAFP